MGSIRRKDTGYKRQLWRVLINRDTLFSCRRLATPEGVPFPHWQPSARKRPRSRFLIAFCAGVAATLLWQSYGDAAREMIADLYQPQHGWLAPRPALSAENRKPSDVIAPPVASAEQPNAMSFDLDVVGQNVEKIATPIAAGQEPRTRSTDQMATGQDQMIRNTDQAAISVDQTPVAEVSGVTVESRGDAASLQPSARVNTKPTEARPPQTLSERGKQLSAASRHGASCFASASAVQQNDPGAWPTWTLRAPGHEGTVCRRATKGKRPSKGEDVKGEGDGQNRGA